MYTNTCNMESEKNVKLRVFYIPNRNAKKLKIEIVKHLQDSLNSSRKIANDRRMRISSIDENKDEDLLSFYSSNSKDYIFGLILRIFPSSSTSNIPDDFLNHETIQISELKSDDTTTKIMFKDHYYFYLSDQYLITNLPLNKGIKRFQTYINWLLKIEEPDDMYEFVTKTKSLNIPKLGDIRNIVFRDSVIYEEHTIKNISGNVFKSIFGDSPEYSEIIEGEMISAKLHVSFKKPKKMDREVFQKFMGAQLNVISDSKDINVITKSGKVINGSDVVLTKEYPVETSSENKISEQSLLTVMKKFHKELCDENSNKGSD